MKHDINTNFFLLSTDLGLLSDIINELCTDILVAIAVAVRIITNGSLNNKTRGHLHCFSTVLAYSVNVWPVIWP